MLRARCTVKELFRLKNTCRRISKYMLCWFHLVVFVEIRVSFRVIEAYLGLF